MNCKSALLIFTLLCLNTLSAIEFSSNEVHVEGNQIFLKGKVSINHELGHLLAQEALVTQGQLDGSSSFLSAALNSCVELELSTKQKLQCENAEFDFVNRRATLSSTNHEIVFTDPIHSMTLQSKDMECTWEQTPQKAKLTSLFAQNTVDISYGTDLFLQANNAKFSSEGTLVLNAEITGQSCVAKIGNDLLKAETATLDMDHEQLTLVKPSGKISSSLFEEMPSEEISFYSNLLYWDRKSGEISLNENILVNASALGNIVSDDQVIFSTEKVDEKLFLKNIQTCGNTTLTTLSEMKIICDGQIDFDAEKKLLTAVSALTPILYQNGDLLIESNQLTIENLESTPTTICFNHHVKFSSGPVQGSAGGLTYYPKEHKLEFYSVGKESVVFINEETNTKMSAEAISLTRDPVTEENQICGHGIVRLSFDHKHRDKLLEVLNSCIKHPF